MIPLPLLHLTAPAANARWGIFIIGIPGLMIVYSLFTTTPHRSSAVQCQCSCIFQFQTFICLNVKFLLGSI